MSKSIKITIIAVGAILTLALIVAFLFSGTSSDGLIVDEDKDPFFWLREITVEDRGDGFKTATNRFDGYRVTVPSGWLVGETANLSSGLTIFSDPDVGPESSSGVRLNVLTLAEIEVAERFVPEGTKFNSVDLDGKTAYGAFYEIFEYVYDKDFNLVETRIPNSGVISYIFPGEDKAYLATCLTIEQRNHAELLKECRQYIETFEIIN